MCSHQTQTVIAIFFLFSASSTWNQNTSLKRSFSHKYCPLFIIQPTLLDTSRADAVFPGAGSVTAERNVGSDSTRSLYDARRFVCHGREPNEPG